MKKLSILNKINNRQIAFVYLPIDILYPSPQNFESHTLISVLFWIPKYMTMNRELLWKKSELSFVYNVFMLYEKKSLCPH